MTISLKSRKRIVKNSKRIEMRETIHKKVNLIDKKEIDLKLCLLTFKNNLFKDQKYDKRTNEFKHTYSLSNYQKEEVKEYFNKLCKKELLEDIKFNFNQFDITKDNLFLYKTFFFNLKNEDNLSFKNYLFNHILLTINKINFLNIDKYFSYDFSNFKFNLNNNSKCDIEINIEYKKNKYFLVNVNYLNF